MRVELLGQACTLVAAGDVRLLSDPWFSGTAHQGGWRPFPSWDAAELRHWHGRADTATHVYLSHDHDDHFDPAFLATLAPKTILVGRFRNARFRADLAVLAAAAGHEVRELAHGAVHTLGDGVSAQVFVEQPSFRTNSVLLLRGAEGSVLNGNDCGLDTVLLREVAARGRPTVFLSTLNFLANGYPFPYLRADSPDLPARAAMVRDDVVEQFRVAMDILRPQMSLAFAGPITFTDAVNAHLDDLPEARDWRAMVAELRRPGMDVAWPAPGSWVELQHDAVARADIRRWGRFAGRRGGAVGTDAARPPAAETVLEAAAALAAELHAACPTSAPGSGRAWATSLVLSAVDSIEDLERGPVRWHIACAIGGDGPCADLLAPGGPLPQPRLQVIAPAGSLLGLCDGSLGYDGFLLSGRARLARVPDSFDSVLHSLLRFGRDPEQAAALAEWWAAQRDAGPDADVETVHKRDGDRVVAIPRRCPHDGEPFDLAEVCHGRITCPRHRWVYDVRTGACLRGDRSINLYHGRP